MKKYFLGLSVLISLWINSHSVQNRLLRLYLECGDPKTLTQKLIPLIIKVKKQHVFIDAINRSNSLNDKEKRYVISILFQSLTLYSRAWSIISNLQDKDKDIVNLKAQLLFQMRDVEGFIKFSKNVTFKNLLSKSQQITFLKYTYLKKEQLLFDDLYKTFLGWTNNNLSDIHYLLENNEKLDHINNNIINENILNQDNLNELQNFLDDLISKSSSKNIVNTFIYLLKIAEKYPEAYSKILEYLYSKCSKQKLILCKEEPYTSLLKAVEHINNNKYKYALENLFEAYKNGEKSPFLSKQILKCLQMVNLRKKYILTLEALFDEGIINITNINALKALSNNKNFDVIFKCIKVDVITADALLELLKFCESLDLKKKRMMYDILVKKIYSYDKKAPLSSDIISYLEKNTENKYELECVKNRWLIDNDSKHSLFNNLEEYKENNKLKMLIYLSKYAFNNHKYLMSKDLAEQAYAIKPNNPLVLRRLASVHHRLGNITMRLHYLEELKRFSGKIFSNEYQIAKDEINLFKYKWTWEPKQYSTIKKGDTIVHVLNKSIPEVNGYTIRSREILIHQKKLGLRPVVVTKLGWPIKTSSISDKEVYDGIEHFRLYAGSKDIRLNVVPMSTYFNYYAEEFEKLLYKLNPKFVHAASNFQNALPALMVAKKHNIPTIYEVRGLWHYTTSSKIQGFEDSERYQFHEEYELYCCNLADKVVVISKSLADHLVQKGISPKKISVVPNGVDSEIFKPQPPDKELINKYNLKNKTVFGFIGSVTKYEGLDYLFQSLAMLKKETINIHFLLVGDGPFLSDLQNLAKELNILDIVTFVGRVPHTEVQKYYSVIDIFPFPRINAKVCQLVTPLKPYEVMAMGKIALVSDIPALNEMVINKETGLVFKAEDIKSLYQCLKDSVQFKNIGLKSRNWVENNRDWKHLIKKYNDVYRF